MNLADRIAGFLVPLAIAVAVALTLTCMQK
jgi:hypothetical protein